MTHKVGDLDGDQVWVRCLFCGDSETPDHAHMTVSLLRGVYFCVRCNTGGHLSAKQLFSLAAAVGQDALMSQPVRIDQRGEDSELPELEPGPANSRKSALPRWHLPRRQRGYAPWDAFYIRDPRYNQYCGVHLRGGDGSKLTLGDKGFAWVNPGYLVSTPSHPLTVVEGPYDVQGPDDLCVFGFITSGKLRHLAGHFIRLCPDGDVWKKPDLAITFGRTLHWCLHSLDAPAVVGVEIIPNGLDPDEVPAAGRQLVTAYEVYRHLRPKLDQPRSRIGDYNDRQA